MVDAAPSRLVVLLERGSSLFYLLALLALFGAVAPQGFTPGSAVIVVQLALPLLVVAIGMTFCLLCGEVDLSVAGVAGLAATLVAVALGQGLAWPLAVLVAVAAGAAMGLLNGLLTAWLSPSFPRFPSFLATLATLSLATGLARFLQPMEQAVAISDPGFRAAFRFTPAMIDAPPLWIAVALLVGAHIVLTCGRFGHVAMAVGLNAQAARYAGLPVQRTRVLVMVLSGTLAGAAGVLLAGYVQAGFAGIATGAEVDAIAAAVIGGAALTGGRGSILGTLWGVLILGVLNTGLLILQVTANWQMIVKGALVILALVLAEAIRRRTADGRE